MCAQCVRVLALARRNLVFVVACVVVLVALSCACPGGGVVIHFGASL